MRQIPHALMAWSGLFLMTTASLGQAQESFGFEEIIVTAQKRETSLQTTPLSILAMSGDALDRSGVESTLDLQLVAPGVLISTNTASAQIYVRGIGTNFGGDQSTAFHVNGVYQATTQAALQDFLDVERIEILKGPQGTLYGRNATGGVVNVITRRPVMDWEFEGDLQIGNYDKFRQRAMVNAPIVNGVVAARLSFVNSDQDGFRRNTYLGTTIDDENHYALRGQILVKPSDNFEALIAADYSNEDSSRTLGFKINKNVFAPQVDLLPEFGLPGGTVPDDPKEIYSDKESIQHYNQYGASLDLKWDLGSVMAKSLTSYRENKAKEDIDIDGTEVSYFNGHIDHNKTKWFSQEFQLMSNSEGPFEWIAGLFFLSDNRKLRGTFATPVFDELGLSDGPIYRDFDRKGKAYAAFGQASYFIQEDLRLTAGARYSYEKKQATQYVNANIDQGVAMVGKENWDAFTPKFGIDYFPNEDVMIYGSVTRGFKTGGFNESATDLFAPEYIWSYEAGIKSTFLDKRLRVNLSAFYYDYSDIQVRQALATPDPITGATTEVDNAASARVKGVELEVTAMPVKGLQISAYGSFLDAKYKDFISPNTEMDESLVDLSGNRLPRAPKFSGSVTVNYTWSVGDLGNAYVQGEMYHQSRIYFNAFNAINDIYDQERSYQVFNARIGFENADGTWNMSFYGKNLGDKVYRQNVIRALGFFGQLDLLAPPRTYGVQLGVKF